MSDSQVPAYVDTRKIFLQQGVIAGSVALGRLARFKEVLVSEKGSVFVELQFSNDEFGQQIISGKLRAEVEVVCQRCLEPLGIVLQDDIRLVLLKDESKVAALDPELDPWICADTKLELANLVEEQLMLCMPIVSFHESTDCSKRLSNRAANIGSEKETAKSTVNPFSVLKSLKESDGLN